MDGSVSIRTNRLLVTVRCSMNLTSQKFNLISGGFLCLDEDECLERTHNCDQTCINLPGTFACKCDQGFEEYMGDGTSCTDNDECNLMTHNCHENADCINIPNAFQCDCKVRDPRIGSTGKILKIQF